MQELFNDYIQSLETYIMFRIKETVARITPELKEKNGRKIIVEESHPKEKTGKGKTRGGAGRKRKSK